MDNVTQLTYAVELLTVQVMRIAESVETLTYPVHTIADESNPPYVELPLALNITTVRFTQISSLQNLSKPDRVLVCGCTTDVNAICVEVSGSAAAIYDLAIAADVKCSHPLADGLVGMWDLTGETPMQVWPPPVEKPKMPYIELDCRDADGPMPFVRIDTLEPHDCGAVISGQTSYSDFKWSSVVVNMSPFDIWGACRKANVACCDLPKRKTQA